MLDLSGFEEQRAAVVALHIGFVAYAHPMDLRFHPVLHFRYD